MITIVDYGAGNIGSVQRACMEIGVKSVVVNTPAGIQNAEKIIFPGIGAAPPAMDTLKRTGLAAALKQSFESGIPILGICIGAQVVLDSSEEGKTPCLSFIPGTTVRFKLRDKSLKIPHIGWNVVKVVQSHPLLEGIGKEDEFYFVHSYYLKPADSENIYAVTDYGGEFCSAIGQKNLFAVQFHPEKSGRLGLQMLNRFVGWDGRVPSKSTESRSR